MPLNRFEDLKGHVVKQVYGKVGDDELLFILDNGEKYRLFHYQDCCESVLIDDIVGSLYDIEGEQILLAEEVSNAPDPEQEYSYNDYSHTWTFYKLATNRGYVTIRWLGTSSGYYSESVEWEQVK